MMNQSRATKRGVASHKFRTWRSFFEANGLGFVQIEFPRTREVTRVTVDELYAHFAQRVAEDLGVKLKSW